MEGKGITPEIDTRERALDTSCSDIWIFMQMPEVYSVIEPRLSTSIVPFNRLSLCKPLPDLRRRLSTAHSGRSSVFKARSALALHRLSKPLLAILIIA